MRHHDQRPSLSHEVRDNRAIFRGASQASKAADFLFAFRAEAERVA